MSVESLFVILLCEMTLLANYGIWIFIVAPCILKIH